MNRVTSVRADLISCRPSAGRRNGDYAGAAETVAARRTGARLAGVPAFTGVRAPAPVLRVSRIREGGAVGEQGSPEDRAASVRP